MEWRGRREGEREGGREGGRERGREGGREGGRREEGGGECVASHTLVSRASKAGRID